MKFVNESKNQFIDCSNEAVRTYEFPPAQRGGFTTVVVIVNPLKISVSRFGTHRIFDAQGVSHCVPPRWVHVAWTTKPGQPNFVS